MKPLLIAMLALPLGCQTARTASGLSADDGDDGDDGEPQGPLSNHYWAEYRDELPPRAACAPGGEAVSLTLTAVSPQPAFTPPEADPNAEIGAPDSGFRPAVRLDACVDTDNRVTLGDVIMRYPPPPPIPGTGAQPPSYLHILPHPQAKVEHLAEALSGDTAALKILMPFGWGDAFEMAGVPGQAGLAYAFQGPISASGSPSSSTIVLGKVELGDPFVNDSQGACPAGATLRKETSKVTTPAGVITTTLLMCERFVQGTYHHTWKVFTVQDTGAPGDAAGRTFTIVNGETQAGTSYEDATVHHNACNSFVAKLPHATYALSRLNRPGNTGAQITGCAPLVAGAPDIEGVPTTVFTYTVYSYAYGAAQPVLLQNPRIEQTTSDVTTEPGGPTL
jgi:hypothetical protein